MHSPPIKEVYTWQCSLAEGEFLGGDPSATQPDRFWLYIIQMVGTRMWGEACSQLRMRTVLCLQMEGLGQESTDGREPVRFVPPVGVPS